MLQVLRRAVSMGGYPRAPKTQVRNQCTRIYHGYSKGTQRNRLSEATPMSSQTTCQSQCTLVGITCTLVGTQRNRLDATSPTSPQSICLNQCTGEPPLPVLPFHIWRQKSYVVGTRGNPLMRQLPCVPKTHV